jgi:chromosome segregation ATPase
MREFLKELGLEKETIDNIMTEYGKNIQSYKDKAEEYKTQIDDYKSKVTEFESQISQLNGTIETNKQSLKNLEDITNENKQLKADIQLSGTNVKKEFSKFVKAEVMEKVNDKVDFSKALEDYKKDNPQYFGETVITKTQTAPNLNNGGTQPPTTSSIMNDIIRNSRNN